MKKYAPEAGDFVWLDFDPAMGREQAGRRPALVLSALQYNSRTGLMIAAPVTSHQKGYPFEVPLPISSQISGVVLADHLKNVDWQERHAEFAGSASPEILRQVKERVRLLLQFD